VNKVKLKTNKVKNEKVKPIINSHQIKKHQSFRLKESKFMHDLDSGMWLRETV
jgi:hypothetical protein